MTYQAHFLTQRLRELKARLAEWEQLHSRLLVEEPFCTADYEPKLFVARYSREMHRVHMDTCTEAFQKLLTEIHAAEYALESLEPLKTLWPSDAAIRAIHDMLPPKELPAWASQALQKKDLPGFAAGPRKPKATAATAA
jgi:hypothetical protein